MDYKRKLQKFNRTELEDLARKLKITRVYKLNKDDLLQAIKKCPEKEIKRFIDSFWQKYRIYFTIIAGLASIIAFLFGLWSHCSHERNRKLLEKKLSGIEEKLKEKNKNFEEIERIKKEYEKKISFMERTIGDMRGVDEKDKSKALDNMKRGNYFEALRIFTELDEKAKKRIETLKREINKERAFYAFNYGEIAFFKLDFMGSLSHYLEAETLAPDNAVYKQCLGSA